jgi:hypothetical protein
MILHLLHHLPLFFPLIGWSASSSSQTSAQKTLTTSGASSPNVTDTGTAAASGSIAVGAQGKYQEAGSIDQSGSTGSGLGGSVGTISAGNGASIVVGDPNADNLISQLAQNFSDAVQGVSASAAQGIQTATSALNQPVPGTNGTITYKTLGLIIGAIAALVALIALFRHKS